MTVNFCLITLHESFKSYIFGKLYFDIQYCNYAEELQPHKLTLVACVLQGPTRKHIFLTLVACVLQGPMCKRILLTLVAFVL